MLPRQTPCCYIINKVHYFHNIWEDYKLQKRALCFIYKVELQASTTQKWTPLKTTTLLVCFFSVTR